jgi:DNA-binding CsgD family transcriptional regulator
VTVAPVQLEEPFVEREAGARIVLVVDPDHRRRAPAQWLCEGYGLTPAEARLAVALANGDSLKEIAEATGNRVGTLRTHLKHVFAKTGTRRQAELVRLVLRGSEIA